MLRCPFCDAEESERIVLEGRSFAVFPCQFTPELDPNLREEELPGFLRSTFAGPGDAYFRATCDRLHLYVAKGEGARRLTAAPAKGTERSADAP